MARPNSFPIRLTFGAAATEFYDIEEHVKEEFEGTEALLHLKAHAYTMAAIYYRFKLREDAARYYFEKFARLVFPNNTHLFLFTHHTHHMHRTSYIVGTSYGCGWR